MSVYVDMSRNRYGRMVMCHMLADTEDELHGMAERIGVRRWAQRSRTGLLHYDICMAKRRMALALGAKEIGRREVVGLMRKQVTP